MILPSHYLHFEILRTPDGSLEMLGKGTMGVTYKAFDRNLRTTCVLKVIHPLYARDERFRERFLHEARTMAGVRHASIAHVYFLGEAEGDVFYAMEYCDGPSLQSHVHRRGPVPGKEACSLVRQLAGALVVMEARGVVHRDIKPGNLILTRDPQGRAQAKLIDFGLATSYGDDAANWPASGGADDFSGTPAYASPEHLEGRQPLSIASDVYALGATWWFLLAGHPPFSGDLMEIRACHLAGPHPWHLLEGQPAPVLEVLRLMLARQVEERLRPSRLCYDLDEILRQADSLFPAAEPEGGDEPWRKIEGEAPRVSSDLPTMLAPSGSTVNTQLAPTLLAPGVPERSSMEEERTRLAPTLLAPAAALPRNEVSSEEAPREPSGRDGRSSAAGLLADRSIEPAPKTVPFSGAALVPSREKPWPWAVGLVLGGLVFIAVCASLQIQGRQPDLSIAPKKEAVASPAPAPAPAPVPKPELAPVYLAGAAGELQRWLITARTMPTGRVMETKEESDRHLAGIKEELGQASGPFVAEPVLRDFIGFLLRMRDREGANRLGQELLPLVERLPAENFRRLEPDLAQLAGVLSSRQLWLAMSRRQPYPEARRYYLERAAALGDTSADAILARFDLQDYLETVQAGAGPLTGSARAKAFQSLDKIRALADQGNGEARLLLAKLYFLGRLVPEDNARALELATAAAGAGSAEATLWQGIIASHLAGSEKTAPARGARWKEAVNILRQLDKDQQPAGYYHLYLALDGLRRDGPPERNELFLLQEMRETLLKGAMKWEARCLYVLGLAHSEGKLPAQGRNPAKAGLFLATAALCGHAPAAQKIKENAGNWLKEAMR